ncbi:hypothetical protein GGS23DRAFT_565259 [Durotheca rogersii]|uniref:uncharacterized protein n=1 Tax=Durotheca rogersii TaxID=419775 RepID=UPI00221FB034|nr:uncharacterized protein GGS23DRAFT_565259 [Durotheca rogersii]KAI5863766.1 hypothetical protein GGS23DRAFT_565259 [Durotheca rogersii]
MTRRILCPASEASATARQVPRKPGFTSISRASYSSSSSSSSSISDEEVVDIPEVFNSRETLEFCGLNSEVSALIFDSWERLQQTPGELGYGNDIITEAKHFVRAMGEREDAWLPEHDWRRALVGMGATQRLCDAILDSAFAHLRKTQSASYWVLDTIDISWEFLEGLDKRIRKKRDETRDLVTPSPSIQPGLLGTYRGPSVLRTATIDAVPSSVEGRTMLFKGGAMAGLVSVFNDDGSLNLARLWSRNPTDFHRCKDVLLYFTKHVDVAEIYADYTMRRVSPEEGVVLHFAVPSELLEDHREIFDPEWQQLVFWSRGPASFDRLSVPPHLTQFTDAPLLIGCIYGMPNKAVARLDRSSDLTGQYMKTRNGGNATQYVFQTEAIQIQLQNQCRGWVWYQSMRYARDFAMRFLPPDEA